MKIGTFWGAYFVIIILNHRTLDERYIFARVGQMEQFFFFADIPIDFLQWQQPNSCWIYKDSKADMVHVGKIENSQILFRDFPYFLVQQTNPS